MGALPPDPKTSPIAIFGRRAWCFYCCYVVLFKLILQLAGVYGFPPAALSLNKLPTPGLDSSSRLLRDNIIQTQYLFKF